MELDAKELLKEVKLLDVLGEHSFHHLLMGDLENRLDGRYLQYQVCHL